MEMRQLRYFVAVVDLGSFSAASRRLRIAQPALSQQIARLEDELGARLLDRSVRGVKPSAAGSVFYNNAQAILRQVEHTRTQIRCAADSPSGLVSVGFPTSVAASLALPILLATRERYPHIVLRIHESLSGYIADLVFGGKLDMAFLFTGASAHEMTVKELFVEQLFFVCPAGDLTWGQCSSVELAGLDRLPMLLPSPAHGLRQLAQKAFDQAGIVLNVLAEIDSLPALKVAVENRVGYSLLPWSAIARDVEAGRLAAFPLRPASVQRTVALCQSSLLPASGAGLAVFDLICEVVSTLFDDGKLRGTSLVHDRA